MNTIGSNNVFSNYVKTLVNDKYGIRSGYAYYDSLTHYYLGRYIRDYKQEKGVDLSSMYNCYSENIISNRRIVTTPHIDLGTGQTRFDVEIKPISSDSVYDLVYVEILPKDKLTLYFESDLPITVSVAAYNGIEFIDGLFDNTKVFASARISNPILYEIPDYSADTRDNSYRIDNLVLLIQIPKQCKKRLILIGDYSNTSEIIVSHDTVKENTQIVPNVNKFFREGRSEAFVDDLMSYLMEYAITENDWIYRNRLFIQQLMSSYKLQKTYKERYKQSYIDGDLDVNMREWIKEFQRKLINKYNATGRVNKDVEELLIRGGAAEC